MQQNDKQLPLFEFDPDRIPTAPPASTARDADDSEFSKYIVYVDESGDHSLESIDRKYPIFVLAFCIFHKRHYSEAIVPALEKFKFNYFGHDQVVLHETDIRKERGIFNIFRSRAEKQQHQKKTHVVVECRGKKEDNELELEFRRICDENRFGRNLPFEILFSDKKTMSSGLQLADLVARPIGLKTLKPEQENRAFDVLTGKFFCHGGREQAGQDYEGIGMKIIPASESEKPR